ncbi:hypothetical protein [Wolbachia endosymbiont (group A) of Scambus nigricans]|uniref:hypothetical protein n=1 Tax=Wolbachia endosymbiont (group A) of Scambus nigricans TaxID=2954055 RepID=UPI0022319969|nr:hypothetical protein [Wolbachia endosymbiont (group A) of Scambus nigricans]
MTKLMIIHLSTKNMIYKIIKIFNSTAVIALFTIIRTDRNMLLACYSHKHISYRIRTIIRKAIITGYLQFLHITF